MTSIAAALLGVALFACRGAVMPEERCADACEQRAKDRCTSRECARGCAFILDRIVEREDGNVIACVAKSKGPCNDETWAVCAAHVGIHADGGPPAPEPAPEEE